ncbi:uncharacterized protein EDB91DRAFT_1250167 [Suillus paluster]|uniref:uncharacterized protein n=1 Tax=Suillus paluster TaxID=48578 RepID=UPI001B877ABA|nr:uncharacterized protein EDB91DRAFT_1250167 [Suillus paluster]KAG1736158.1 hypothetical protein EDB91DRAFT_1250167 [Suillus paluster]
MPHWGQELTPSPLSPGSMPLPPDGDLFTDSSRVPQPHFQQGAYMHEIQQFQTLREKYRALELQIAKVTAERDTISAAYQYLASAVRLPLNDLLQLDPASIPTPASNLQRPKPETHPNIRFWNKADYFKWLESAEADNAVGRGKLAFLEDENGDPISETTIDAIRKALPAAWSELLSRKLAPLTWGKLTASGSQLVNTLMENAYPLFKFANNGWKLDYLATISYSSWCRHHMDECGNPLSGGDAGDDGDNTSKGKKRKQRIKSEASEVLEKKIKVDHDARLGESTVLPLTPPPSSTSSPPLLLVQPFSLTDAPLYSTPSLTPSSPPQLLLQVEASVTPEEIPRNKECVSPTSQQSTLQIQGPVAATAQEPLNDITNILPKPLSAPKPVKIMIINPLSTLALAASNVVIPPTAAPSSIPLSLLDPGTELKPKDAGSIPAPSESTRKTPKMASKAKMHPGNTKNGRNLCALRWLKLTKRGGTTDEFNAYYGTLTSDQLGKYNEEAKNLVSNDAWNKNVNKGQIY